MESNMTVREVAVRLGWSFAHCYNLVRSGRLPGAFKADGEWKVPEAALNVYLERRNRRAGIAAQNTSGESKQVKAAA